MKELFVFAAHHNYLSIYLCINQFLKDFFSLGDAITCTHDKEHFLIQ
jgi:hypothetical protein